MTAAERGVEIAESQHLLYWHTNWLLLLSEAYLLAGEQERAFHIASRSLDLSRSRQERGLEVWACYLRGEAGFGRLEVAAVAATYHEAIAAGEALSLRPLVARIHAGLAKLHRHTGRAHDAQEHFSIAAALYREMGMTYWLERAEKECAAG